MRQENPSLVVLQILGRKPAHALDEGAGDLSAVDAWIDGLSDVHEKVAPKHLHLASEPIDEHLGTRDAHREVEKRMAAGRPIPVDPRSCIKSTLAEWHP